MSQSQAKVLFLASTSRYKRELLERLHLPFQTLAIETDERIFEQEAADNAALRLAGQKALSAATHLSKHGNPAAIVIGCDQIAFLKGAFLGKPGSFKNAFTQLQFCSQQVVDFYTAVCLYDCQQKIMKQHLERTQVHFRKLSKQEITRYLQIEEPYDCAGSFKAEGLGICLFEKIVSQDPSALLGLPLIGLSTLLREHHFNVLKNGMKNTPAH